MKIRQEDFTLELVLKRLTVAEIQLKKTQQELELKNHLIIKLQTKLSKIQESILENSFSMNEFIKMKEKLEQVEKLFKKNGFTFENLISENSGKENSELKKILSTFQEKKEGEKFSKPIQKIKEGISFGMIVTKIAALNETLEKELNGKIIERKKGTNIHKLTENEKIKIKFYKNGFKLHLYSFFMYESKVAQQILIDFIEGFYPNILEKSFPEGVLFEI